MKVTIDAKELVRALAGLVKPERKPTIPILAFAKLTATVEGGVSLASTDLDMSAMRDVAGSVVEPGTCLLPYHAALDVLKGESGAVTVTLGENNWVTAAVNDCEYKLVGAALANFPAIRAVEGDLLARIPARLFVTLAERVAFAISREESRYTLNGALLSFETDTVRMVATDGHRLSNTTAPLESVWRSTDKGFQGKLLIPSSAIAWLRANLGEGDVDIFAGGGDDADFIWFAANGLIFSMRKLKGQFPNYEAVMPREDSLGIRLAFGDPASVVKTLARVAKCAEERSGAVKWHINGQVTISAETTNIGKASAILPAEFAANSSGAEVVFGLKADYVSEFLKASQAGATTGKAAFPLPVTLGVRDAQSASMWQATVPDGQSWRYVLMPMRV